MSDESKAAASLSESSRVPSKGGIPFWAKGLVVLSGTLMVAGIAAPMLGLGGEGQPHAPAGGDVGTLAMSSAMSGEPTADGMPAWSPAVFRLGFSFFVAFAMAYAMRVFFKMAMVFVGFTFLLLFGLQYAELIEVKWGVMETRYDSISVWLQAQTQSFVAFVTGYLPSAAAASAGLIAGFRRSG